VSSRGKRKVVEAIIEEDKLVSGSVQISWIDDENKVED